MPNIFASVITDGLTIGTYLLLTAVALACGALAAFAAGFRTHASAGFLTSLVLLPVIVETVILMVNGNVGTGVAVMGAFSLVRFRAVAGRAREIVSIFLSMTVGLSCAAGYIGVAILLTVIVCAVMTVLALLPLRGRDTQELRITVPESLHFVDAFEDIFAQYTASHTLITVKTANMGSLYKLHYRVELKDKAAAQAMMDDLRCRNGNLEIALCEAAQNSEEL